jgi:autophagy-related protein 2
MGTLRYISLSLVPNLRANLEGKGLSRRNSRTEFDVNFVMVRIQLRCPSPPSLPQRSGAGVLDIHGLSLTSRLPRGHREVCTLRPGLKAEPADRNSSSRDNHLLTAEWRALLMACSSVGAETARSFCSVGPLSSPVESEDPSSKEHIRFLDDTSPTRRFAFIKLAQNQLFPSKRKGKRSDVFVAEVDVPSVCLNFSKPLFDTLQFWIDDVTQLLERTLAPSSDGTRENSSRNPSLVGSRFFSNSKQGSVDTTDNALPDHSKPFTERIIKVTISEGEHPTPYHSRGFSLDVASMRLLIPYQIEGATNPVEAFDILVSDADVLLESKPEGKVRSRSGALLV